MKLKKTFLLLTALLLALVTVLPGCGQTQTEYSVYYADSTESQLIPYTVKFDDSGMTPEEIMMRLLEEMSTPRKGSNAVVIKPTDVTEKSVTLTDKVAVVELEGDYAGMNTVTELLYRTAVVKELTQVYGVERVTFMQDGEVITTGSGDTLENMAASAYVDDSGDKGGNVEWRDINLYFANKDGTKLVRTGMTVAYNKNMSLEKIVVSKLLAGPTDSRLQATIPDTVSALSVSMRDGICYVNLSESFLTDYANVSGDLPIYSIVDSLCDLESVKGVRILVNGSTSAVFRETIPLDSTFTADYSMVEEQ
ncbi:MAG: GerMN domain-containing protein [Lachnospiraceae bacterium]|jgi:germination protein M|nr:GerMN domain-containing protein [Lachnospiraceae bacterium]MCH4030564.1 GerMN domain-containing protein [Lachnospiraceae bacterium]MCH4069773.1 GerMN domain-containing protein [Lachnospiraceae bacterium]MCH4107288.1 GerMN domain-containing protein [Lachnospiraceae bacterium]MCI1301857.1 GerMN domain-containing protein [Lachnospiraceae bacterium]